MCNLAVLKSPPKRGSQRDLLKLAVCQNILTGGFNSTASLKHILVVYQVSFPQIIRAGHKAESVEMSLAFKQSRFKTTRGLLLAAAGMHLNHGPTLLQLIS